MEKINCVLLIDDDSATSSTKESIVPDLNIPANTKVLTNAGEALNYLQNKCKHNCPELVLLDIKIRGMGGLEFLEALDTLTIRNKDKIKVVMLSSSLMPRETEQSEEPEVIDLMWEPLKTYTIVNLLPLHFN
ncbi:MAG TPA: response regulator [Cytophagales bacterium]|nr:response regulator [Cytophagales bacterium]